MDLGILRIILNKLINYVIKLFFYVVIKLKLRFCKMIKSFTGRESCIFCEIIEADGDYSSGNFIKTPNILFTNDRFIILEDIVPVSDHHYLAIPRHHIDNALVLTKNDIPLGNLFMTCCVYVYNITI